MYSELKCHPTVPCPNRIFRIEIEIEPLSVLNWLHAQHDPEKLYWAPRGRHVELAGAGIADLVTGKLGSPPGELLHDIDATLARSDAGVRFYGGLVLDSQQHNDSEWAALSGLRFVVPKFELLCKPEQTVLAFQFKLGHHSDLGLEFDRLGKDIELLVTTQPQISEKLQTYLTIEHCPEREQWCQIVETALRLIGQGELQKIVLARKSIYRFAASLQPLEVLRYLPLANQSLFRFLFQMSPHHGFLGISPEQLYSRAGKKLHSDAIAGTRPRGVTTAQDIALGQALLHDDKELREHRFVSKTLLCHLNTLCTAVEWINREELLKLDHVQHLYSRFRGDLRENICDWDILKTLHPTPAVGGSPRSRALPWIKKLEPFARGWYANPVGCIDQNEAEFAVAIRSALIDDNKLLLYAGAGIVQGSEPEKEWDEIEKKMMNYTRLFKQPCQC